MTAARIHIFTDSIGWSPQKDAQYEQLELVRSASELPPIARNCLITFFNASDAGDLEYLQDRLQELREDATWE